MIRNLALAAAAATMAAAPMAAQAAPARVSAPVAADNENAFNHAGWVVPVVAFLLGSLALILIWDDGDDAFPTSP
jgi:hypothetical protein